MRISKWHPLRAAGASLTLILTVAMHPLPAEAERGNGETPEEATVCEAADLDAAAWGLCNAYCEAMDCAGDDPQASDRACERVLENWEKHADGLTIPCEQVECPCWSSSEELDLLHDSLAPPTYGRPLFGACWYDEDGFVISVAETVSRTLIGSRISATGGTCGTVVRHRGETALPVVGMFDLTDDEVWECSRVLEGLCQ
jgi:hypothetical protein